MSPNLIAMAIPAFFVLIFTEAGLAMGKRVKVYRFTDAITDLSCGIASRMFHLFDLTLILAAYTWVYSSFRLFSPDESAWWLWASAFIGLDCLYYVWHRASHEINVLWAIHGVHHQSEDYNLAVALRQALFSSISLLPFYLPLAVLGVPPLMFAACSALNTLYQFWIHTELIVRLPAPIEAVMNTPSHHRVHHGINPQYLDRNHAGVFIVWDRLFGTFEAEDEPVVYGLVSPLRSYNPLWANFAHFRDIGRLVAATPSWSDKAKVLLKGPAWRPGGALKAAPVVERATFTKYDPSASKALVTYVCGWFVLVGAATVWLMVYNADLTLLQRAVGASGVVWTLVSWGGLFEGRSWAKAAEFSRLGYVVFAAALFANEPAVLAGVAAGATASALWFHRGVASSSSLSD